MLLESLKAEQVKMGLLDADFAAFLKIPRVTWTVTRNGSRPLTNRTVKAAMRAFPHLMPECVFFLLSESTRGKSSDTKVNAVTSNSAEVAR